MIIKTETHKIHIIKKDELLKKLGLKGEVKGVYYKNYQEELEITIKERG